MFVINCEIDLNPIDKIIKDHGLEDDGRVQLHLRNVVDNLSDPYVPMDSGILKNAKYYPNNHSIKYISPYAHYMYKGELMLGPSGSAWARLGEKKHYSGKALNYRQAPKRGADWTNRMVAERINDIILDMENYIKRGAK